MGVDLTQLSDEDLVALKSGDITRVSDAGLMTLKGAPAVRQPMQEPAFEREARQLTGTTGPELIAGAAPTRFALGAASPIMGLAQIAARNPIGRALEQDKWIDERIARIEAMKQRGMKAYGQEGMDIAGMMGAVASGLGAAKLVPAAKTLGTKVAQGIGLGTVAGATTPVEEVKDDFASRKATQTGMGAAVGGGIPVATATIAKGGRTLYNAFLEPWMAPAAIKGRAFLEAAGDKADEIMALLRESKQIVPGSAPTAGEAAVPAGRAEFAALQRSASKVEPSAALERSDAQNAARLGAVRTVGQDAPALAAAEAERKAAAGPLYAAAREGTAPVDTANVLQKVDGLLAKNPGNRELVTELTNVRKGLVDAEGTLRTNPQEVASVLDGLKTAIADEKNKFIRGQLTNIKDRLARSIPGYEQAQTMFREKSAPINQMQIGQFLEQKLTPALSEEAPQRATSFAGALRDAPGTIKRATGAPRFENLSQALTPEQLSVVNAVRDDLARSARFEGMASKGAGAGPNAVDLATSSMERELGGRLPNILHRGAMIANSIVYRLEGKINRKLASEIAAEMLEPPVVAESMRQAQLRAARRENMAKAIEMYVNRPSTIGAAQAQARE